MTRLSKKEASASFTDPLKKSGYCDHLKPEERPTFHECIALGEHLMEKTGWAEKWIQRLWGHKKIETTCIYLEGH